jgi:hypothetical protein
MVLDLDNVARMIEIAREKIMLDTELLTLLRAHEREVNALTARRGLALLVGGCLPIESENRDLERLDKSIVG